MAAKIIPLTRPEPNFSAALILSTVPANPKNRNTGIPLKKKNIYIYTPYARHYSPLSIRNRSRIQTADFRLKNEEFPFLVHKLSVI